jgi:ABC-type transport system involved in multi-copper enzyme maturation permease subunit
MSFREWILQTRQVVRVELLKFRRGRIWIPPAVLAALPILIMLFPVAFGLPGRGRRLPIDYASFFQNLWLRFMIFFSCGALFSQLFRGEVLEKTLHHYYLVPIRREAVAVGKFITALMYSAILFTTGTALNYFLFFWPSIDGRAFLLTEPGIEHMFRYVALAGLACAAYGALFLIIGLTFRNPMIPGLFVLCWETFNYVLPSFFQHLSVTLYLRSFMPVTVLNGPFGIAVEPPAPPTAAAGLLVVSLGIVALSAFVVRHLPITYSAD